MVNITQHKTKQNKKQHTTTLPTNKLSKHKQTPNTLNTKQHKHRRNNENKTRKRLPKTTRKNTTPTKTTQRQNTL